MFTKNLPEIRKRQHSLEDPFRNLSRLQRNIDQLFEHFFEPSSRMQGLLPEESMSFSPPCDIDETDTHYLLTFDLPGVTKNDLKIEVKDNELIVSGERKEETREEKPSRHMVERFYGSFERTFTLPSSVDPEKVEASYDSGVLRIALPKTEETKAKKIEVTEGKGGFFSKLLERREERKEKKEKVA